MDKPPRIPPAEAYRSPDSASLAMQCAEIATQMVHVDNYQDSEILPDITFGYLHTDAYGPESDAETDALYPAGAIRIRQTTTVGIDSSSSIEAGQRGTIEQASDEYRVFCLQLNEAYDELDDDEPSDWQDIIAIVIKPEDDETVSVNIVDQSNGNELSYSELVDFYALLSAIEEQQRKNIFQAVAHGYKMSYADISATKTNYQQFYPGAYIDGAPCLSCWNEQQHCTHQQNQPNSN